MRYGRFTMTASKRSGTSRPANRKRQLIDHSAQLFLRHGYPQVSMADIARAAGVTAPSLYRHFADKQALLYDAVLTGVDDLQTCTTSAVASSGGDSHAFITSMCGSMARRQNASTLWRWTGTYLTPEQNREVVQGTRAVLRQWADVLFAERDLADWEQRQLVWTLLSVVGSLSVHRARLPSAQAVRELTVAAERLVALTPSAATPLRVPPDVELPGDDRRTEILDAAAQLFADRGYGPVTVDEIGAAVGITGPSVYRHFPSKATILIEIGRRSGARLEVGVVTAYATGTDDADRLSLLVDSYVATITSIPDLSVSFNNASALAGDPGARELVDVQRRYVSRWTTLMTSLYDIGEAQAAIAVHAALSIVNDAVRVRRGVERPDFGAQMAYLMRGVLGL
ncbi:TetR/AcrR family transcriptional regulator [Gordonia sp. HY366]|uniref:TetR/AcrR family transcriptional regulator n=2 Tax=Gordonia liuliyuniae TaxID=2911517 RepID=A0ABS9IPC0_9ACTN|nr:TetR/AcrR family transcriptional regulator [Gordonia liuliyuniae]MCF8587399.1 TetR/AcrR family transcriptional regulator [Gordonia liuliyuniae]